MKKIREFIRKIKLTRRERQVEYWIAIYDEAYPKSEVTPTADSLEVNNNDLKIKKFKNEYPFYKSIIKLYLNKRKYNEEEIRIRVVEEIITYFEVVYNNKEIEIKTNNYTSISSKRTFSNEKKNILLDLNRMLFEAILYSKIKELQNITKLNKIKKEVETPINIVTNEVDVIPLEKRNPIEQTEVIRDTIDKKNKHFTSPSLEVKLEIETNENTATRKVIILELKKHNFVELMNPVCSEEILNFLLDDDIIDDDGKWISKNLKRSRDVALFIGRLFENNLLATENQADVCRKATSFFEKKIDTGQLNTIIKFIKDDNIPTNDEETYQYLSFLDEIKI
ncbi:hypothetical protein [Polaribacter glomeratus]|uniref:Uncharacterized protein n=1 Tax=Polaribacter glomeratus TaxID=102 RepID=A0A2S7WYI2_9FLAO|nr:hypothetical protein [Polaribacter glomeratus]PQJ82623.1 hypothetical protein BTO16_08555 [Polaribacter glomeratus]TXD64921.1 hypothetical protein ESX12_12310 [Polaribacter glomeratus]